MNATVVDTNVCIVANGASPQADPTCVQGAIRRLREARRTGLICIDDGFRILNEYRAHLSESGHPGPGDIFLRWLLQNRHNRRHCEQVRITPKPGVEDDFEEFPNDPELERFDPGDRKFVAVARASVNKPTILNAVDMRSWPKYKGQLARHGVAIDCLCPHLMKE
jgi:hypothetical protein